MKRVGLSIDWDFWVREKPEWDFGHSENNSIFLNSAWQIRYLHVPLEKECDIHKHADFDPLDIMIELEEKNLIFAPDFPLGIADSHRLALDWFKRFDIDYLINLDAHHDCWGIDPKKPVIDCGNWISGLSTEAIWVYPKWKNPKFDPNPTRKIRIESWEDFKLEEAGMITSVFICRSSAWTPPHLDERFGELVELLTNFSNPVQLQAVPIRPDIDLVAMKQFRRELRSWQEDALSDELKKKELSEPGELSESD